MIIVSMDTKFQNSYLSQYINIIVRHVGMVEMIKGYRGGGGPHGISGELTSRSDVASSSRQAGGSEHWHLISMVFPGVQQRPVVT